RCERFVPQRPVAKNLRFSLRFRGLPPGRAADLRIPIRLNFVRVDYCRNQSRKSLIDLCAARYVVHLDASTLPPNQSRLSENLEMLRERRFRDGLFADL